MKKKLIAVVATAMLMLALPGMAFAANSPTDGKSKAETSDGITAQVSYSGAGNVAITAHDIVTPNFDVKTSEKVISTFEIVEQNGAEVNSANPVTFSMNAGSQYANCAYRISVVHGDGTPGDTIQGYLDSNGSCTITITKLSTYTLVVDPTDVAKSDTSSVSPKTGVNALGFAGAAAVAVIAAGGVALVLRKKVTE